MKNTQLGRLNQVTNKMIINCKAFHVRMKYKISGEISDTKVVREHVGGDCTGARSSDNSHFTHCSSAPTAVMARYLASVEDKK